MQPIEWVRRLFPALAVSWAVALPVAAVATAQPTPPAAARLIGGAAYAAGAVVCHQRPERSFRWGGRPWPVCARCSGIYGAAALSVVPTMFVGRRRRSPRALASNGVSSKQGWKGADAAPRVRAIAAAALMPTMTTLVWEWTTGTPPSNVVRALAGLPIGVFVAWIVMRMPRHGAQSG